MKLLARLLVALTLAVPVVTLAAQTAQTVYKPGNGVSLPSVIRQVKADYTPEAMAQRIEGVVGLECVVRTDGTVSDIKVVKSLDSIYGLDRKATEAMEQWRFKPGMKDGAAVAVQINVEMNFTLK